MSTEPVHGTPSGIRAHQAAAEALCTLCTASEMAWLERLAFITPLPSPTAAPIAAPVADLLPVTVERRRVLATNRPDGRLVPRIGHHEEAAS